MAAAAIAVSVGAMPARPVFSGLPPLAHSGGFGEPTCHVCHDLSSLNEPPGQVNLDVPPSYSPNAQYRVTVSVAYPGLLRGGFELTARLADGSSAGRQAGRLSAVDARVNIGDTSLGRFGAVQYARHTRDPHAGRDLVSWTVQWKAPADEAGAVIFHVAANAANDDNSPLGDVIYTASRTAVRASTERR